MKAGILVYSILSVFVAACDTHAGNDAKKPPATTPPVADARAAVVVAPVPDAAAVPPVAVVPKDAGPPADPAVEKQASAELAALADAFCACKDMQCVAALEEKVGALQTKYASVHNSAVVARAAGEFQARASKCLHELRQSTGTASPMVLDAEKAADDVCACQDATCVKNMLDAAKKSSAKYAGVKGTKVDEDRMLAATQRMTSCMNRISGP